MMEAPDNCWKLEVFEETRRPCGECQGASINHKIMTDVWQSGVPTNVVFLGFCVKYGHFLL